MEKRTRRLNLRLTEEEWSRIEDAAHEAGASVSEYVRSVALHPERPTKWRASRFKDGSPHYRTERVRVNVTPAEKEWIEQRAKWLGWSVPATVRLMLFAGKDVDPIVIDTTALREVYLELNREGSNLNQLVRRLNACGGDAEALGAREALRKIVKQLDRMDAVQEAMESQIRAVRRRGGRAS